MTKIFIYLSLIFAAIVSWIISQQQPKTNSPDEITVCHAQPTDMVAFLDDPNFISFHPAPMPIDFQGVGKMVSFATKAGDDAGGYFIPAKEKSDQWLFVYQEWWGLNNQIKQEADKFFRDLDGNVNVLALDMYDGKVTSDPQEAGTIMRNAEEERLENIVKGAQSFAGKDAKIANVGWCFGGSWSLKSALLLGDQNVGSIIYYGMPERNVEKLKKLNSDVLGLFGTEQYISKEVIEEFAASMEAAGQDLDYRIFNGPHGFANPSNPKHSPEDTQEAYAMALDYLKGKFM